MQEKDLKRVTEIERENFSVPWSEEGFRSSLHQNEYLFLTVVAEGEVAGYCGLLQSFDEADITNVAVDKRFRRQGIGYLMLTRLMELGRERGIERYTLEVRAGNEPAIALYEKLGFASVGIRKGFYSMPKEDAVIMWTK